MRKSRSASSSNTSLPSPARLSEGCGAELDIHFMKQLAKEAKGTRQWRNEEHLNPLQSQDLGPLEPWAHRNVGVAGVLLLMDLVLSNHSQVTKTTPELAPPFHANGRDCTMPMGGTSSLDRFNVHRPLYSEGLQ
ncbi:hypothetical protein TNCV_1807271 [Trichonephila clavipes]|nr:hypothetical protein TNCV_1807271 [Trichonephila clavipes]